MKASKDYLVNEQYATAKNLEQRISLHRFGTNTDPFWSWVRDKYPLNPKDEILEVGCGPGTFWKEVIDSIPENCHVTLTDFSQGMADAAKQKLESSANFSFEVADVESLQFSDHSFNAVLAHFMLYHASNIDIALKEIKRVLKPDGFAGILLPSRLNMQPLFDLIECDNPVQALHFSSETAKDILPKYFGEIQTFVNGNVLQLNEIKPIIAYVKSLPEMNKKDMTFYQRSRDIISELILKNGCIEIEIQQSLFICR